jgi:hypothetical protein
MEQKRILRVVASPGDVQAERNAIRGVLDELNRGIAGNRNPLLELTRCETTQNPAGRGSNRHLGDALTLTAAASCTGRSSCPRSE